MEIKEMVDLTNDIVQRYYQNDIQPFLDHVDKRVLWYGPAKGQFLSGRQAVLDAWADEKHSLNFTLGNVRLDHISTQSSYCEVMMSFPVTTHFPEGGYITMDQIIHITWCERKVNKKTVPRMLVVHISDLYQKHKSDNIYPVHLKEIYQGYLPVLKMGSRLYFRGNDASDMYIIPETIIWVESTTYGRHSILHTLDGDFGVTDSPVTLETEHSDYLLRCHKCYLVNPRHITAVRRFNVTMSDGKEIPIPEKKYTAFKKAVHDKWAESQSII